MTINELVLLIKSEEKGSPLYESTYAKLFQRIMNETIYPKVLSYESSIKGDVSEGISIATELLMDIVGKWDGTGNFHTFYKVVLENKLSNFIIFQGRDKRSHNTNYAVSLSEDVTSHEGGSTSILEVTNEEVLQTTFEITDDSTNSLESLLYKFSKEYPKQYEVIEIMLNFSDDVRQKEKTDTYCRHYGVQEYTSVIQKRVSRVRKRFKKFLQDNNYEGVVL